MEPSNWLTLIGIFLAVETTLITAIWGFAWWLSKKFNHIYEKIQTTLDLMINKLEYHERHDDQRFSDINNGLWAIRVEQASKKAKCSPIET